MFVGLSSMLLLRMTSPTATAGGKDISSSVSPVQLTWLTAQAILPLYKRSLWQYQRIMVHHSISAIYTVSSSNILKAAHRGTSKTSPRRSSRITKEKEVCVSRFLSCLDNLIEDTGISSRGKISNWTPSFPNRQSYPHEVGRRSDKNKKATQRRPRAPTPSRRTQTPFKAITRISCCRSTARARSYW